MINKRENFFRLTAHEKGTLLDIFNKNLKNYSGKEDYIYFNCLPGYLAKYLDRFLGNRIQLSILNSFKIENFICRIDNTCELGNRIFFSYREEK